MKTEYDLRETADEIMHLMERGDEVGSVRILLDLQNEGIKEGMRRSETIAYSVEAKQIDPKEAAGCNAVARAIMYESSKL